MKTTKIIYIETKVQVEISYSIKLDNLLYIIVIKKKNIQNNDIRYRY